MRLTRITVLTTLACAAAACGIDAVGALAPIDLPDASTATPANDATAGEPVEPADGSGDGATNDAGITDAAVDADADAAPLVPPYIVLTHAPATGTIDLTTEGSKEWAYWGVDGSTTSVRNAGAANLISALYYPGSATVTTGTGFGATLAWSNGPVGSVTGSGDWFYAIDAPSASGFLFVRAPAGAVQQTFTVMVGGANVRGRMTASFGDSSVTAKVDNTYSNLAGTIAVKYVAVYASVAPTSLELRWEPDVAAASGGELRFTAAALR